MHPNWKPLIEKWGYWKIDEADEGIVDISDCVYAGQGFHEICIFTFGRYVRLSEARGDRVYPLCVAFGPWFGDHVSKEEPAISLIRSLDYDEAAALPEKLRLLAVISCENGSALSEALRRKLTPLPSQPTTAKGFQKWSWHLSNIALTLDVVNQIQKTQTFPLFVEQPQSHSDASVSISIEDLPADPFPGYDLSEEELAKPSGWWGNLKKRVPTGEQILAPHPERIVLLEDLRRLADGLHRGQLGWTNPTKGLFRKKGSSSYWLTVTSDSGATFDVQPYWIDFVKTELADEVSRKMIESYRGTPYDADTAVAEKWHRNSPNVDTSELKIVGRGFCEVYAFTFSSCVEDAKRHNADRYPMKIGFTAGLEGALRRVQMQTPVWMSQEPTRVLLVGRCDDGRVVEQAIHKHLDKEGRRVRDALGKEWYSSNLTELEALFHKYGEAARTR